MLHQTSCQNIQSRKTVSDNTAKFMIEPCFYDLRERISIETFCFLITDILQFFLGSFNDRRKLSVRNGQDHIDLISDPVGIIDDDLFADLLPEIGKFFQHLIGGSEIQRHRLIRIRVFHRGEQNPSEFFIFRIFEMYVTGSYDRFAVCASQLYDSSVDLFQILSRSNIFMLFIIDQIQIVCQRLNLQIIIEGNDSFDSFSTVIFQNSFIELSAAACRSQDQSFPVFFDHALGHSGLTVKIIQMGTRDQFIEIFQSDLILHQQDRMMRTKLFHIGMFMDILIDFGKNRNLLVPKVFQHTQKDLRSTFGIIDGTMMCFQFHAQMTGYRIQGIPFQFVQAS